MVDINKKRRYNSVMNKYDILHRKIVVEMGKLKMPKLDAFSAQWIEAQNSRIEQEIAPFYKKLTKKDAKWISGQLDAIFRKLKNRGQ